MRLDDPDKLSDLLFRDGRSRLFGFIGFKTSQEAKDAVEYFNKSFFDTSRIFVELAKQVGDNQLERPWSRYSKGSSAHKDEEYKQVCTFSSISHCIEHQET